MKPLLHHCIHVSAGVTCLLFALFTSGCDPSAPRLRADEAPSPTPVDNHPGPHPIVIVDTIDSGTTAAKTALSAGPVGPEPTLTIVLPADQASYQLDAGGKYLPMTGLVQDTFSHTKPEPSGNYIVRFELAPLPAGGKKIPPPLVVLRTAPKESGTDPLAGLVSSTRPIVVIELPDNYDHGHGMRYVAKIHPL